MMKREAHTTFDEGTILRNKTINLANLTLTGTTAQFNTALSDGSFATLAGIEILTNKTIALGSNTVSGSIAQFNTALTDGKFVTTGQVLLDQESVTWGTGGDVIIQFDDTNFLIDMTGQSGEFIINGGSILVSNGDNIEIGHIAVVARSSTSPTNALNIFNGTAPSGTLANGVTLYSKDVTSSAELHVMDEAGNETLLSPHDPLTGEWVFSSTQTVSGKKLTIRMEAMMRRLDEMLGGGYIEESEG